MGSCIPYCARYLSTALIYSAPTCANVSQPSTLQLEEGDLALMQDGRSIAQQKVAVVKTLVVFCNADPSLLADHVIHLATYLKGDRSVSKAQQACIIQGVALIMSRVLPIIESLDQMELPEMEADLKKLVMTMSPIVLSPVLASLALIGARPRGGSGPNTLLQLGQKFHGYLNDRAQVESEWLNQQVHPALGHLSRALYTLGLVCRHCGGGDDEGNVCGVCCTESRETRKRNVY